MAKKENKILQDLIPARAGVFRIIPYDITGKLLEDQAVTSQRNFIVSTQMTESRSNETLANGNGTDGDYPTDTVYNLAISTNIFDPAVHAMISGNKLREAETTETTTVEPFLLDTTIMPAKATGLGAEAQTAEFTFAKAAEYPVASSDGQVYLEIKDSYGNVFSKAASATSMQPMTYFYDADSHKVTVAAQYDSVPLSCIYYIDAGADASIYEAPVTPATPRYKIIVRAEMKSADKGNIVLLNEVLTKAAPSGDIPNVTSQKQITNTITYNFKSQPVPEGVVPFKQIFKQM